MRLSEYQYRSVARIQGPLMFVDGVHQARLGEVVHILAPDGRRIGGEVLRIDSDTALIQIFGESQGLDLEKTRVIFTDSVKRAPLGPEMIGRTFSGAFAPLDGQEMFVPSRLRPVTGAPINPTMRNRPQQFIETGFSAIDGLNTLVKGQKLPVFSCAGLPSKELVAGILKQARVPSVEEQGFAVIFVALGLTHLEYAYYMETLQELSTESLAFINLASDPVVERLLAPRLGLTAAEYLAFELGYDVLVVISDITNYCEALREISSAREELPGRRGYPGYMYSDLSSLYERAGRLMDQPGSVTILPVVTMPEDDITHPIPDLTGYITEGQIVLSRQLHQKGLFPPVDVLPSLSRLMQQGIGEGRTRQDHRELANRLYRHYARGRDLRNLEAIVGREGMSASDHKALDFAEAFEARFIHQGLIRRDILQTLDTGARLLDTYQRD